VPASPPIHAKFTSYRSFLDILIGFTALAASLDLRPREIGSDQIRAMPAKVSRKPMQAVDGQIASQHGVVLGLKRQRAALHGRYLIGPAIWHELSKVKAGLGEDHVTTSFGSERGRQTNIQFVRFTLGAIDRRVVPQRITRLNSL